MKKSILSVIFLLVISGFAFAGTSKRKVLHHRHHHHPHHHQYHQHR